MEPAGKFPKILEDEVVGEAATDLYQQAQIMLKDIIENKRFDARAVFGLYPAKRTAADTVTVYDEQGTATHHFEHLRQQSDKVTGKPNLSLADFIVTEENQTQDYLGVLQFQFLVLKNLPMNTKLKVMTIVLFWFSLWVTVLPKLLPSTCMNVSVKSSGAIRPVNS